MNKLTRCGMGMLTAGCVAVGSFVGAAAASAQDDYPGKVEKKFVSECVAAGKKKAGDDVKTSDLRAACKTTLTCIEGKLTFQEFKKASATNPAIKQCIKKTKQQAAS